MKVLLFAPERLAGFIRAGLADEGVSVDWAEDAPTVEGLLRGGRYDAAIVDVGPRWSHHVLEMVEAEAAVPVMRLVAEGKSPNHRRERPSDGHLVKPFKFDQLLDWLRVVGSHKAAT